MSLTEHPKMKPCLTLLFVANFLFCTPVIASTTAGSGLEINAPTTLQLVYTIEPNEIDQAALESIVTGVMAKSDIELAERPDAQLFLRVEKHAGRYLLYLDFSREMQYQANGQTYNKDGFVWGRYAKNIENISQLHEDVLFFIEEFVDLYSTANHLN